MCIGKKPLEEYIPNCQQQLSVHFRFLYCLNFYKSRVYIPPALGWIYFIRHLAATRLCKLAFLLMDLTVYKVKSGGKHVDLLSADRLISKAIWASFLEFFPSPSKAQNVISTHLNSQRKQWWLQADEDWDGFCTSICHLWFLDNYFHQVVLIRRQDWGEGLVLFIFKSSVSGSGLAQSRYSINVTQKISVFNNNHYFKNIYFIENHHTLKLTFWCADLWIFTHV